MAIQKSLGRLHLELCSACLAIFLVMGQSRVDKTNQYDLENIRSTAPTPHFIDLELRSGEFKRDNESYPELISLFTVAFPELRPEIAIFKLYGVMS